MSKILIYWNFEKNLLLSNIFLNRVSKDFHYKFFVRKILNELDSDTNESIPLRVSNQQLGLQLDIQLSRTYNRRSQENIYQPIEGLRVIIHSPYELPSTKNLFYHASDRDNYVFVTPEMTLIDDEVKAMSIEKRNCFLSHERVLKYFWIYTKENCEQECLSLKISKTCGCVPFYMISKCQLVIICIATHLFH